MEKLLILDIDETLIHATSNQLEYEHDFEVAYYYVYKRPHLSEFLEFCMSNFKVAVWTTAGEIFAEEVVNTIFPEPGALEFVWSSKRCTPKMNPETYEMVEVKNLAKVKKRGFSLDSIIMIDDTPEKLMLNYGNLVKVKEFVGSREDNELPKLVKYLEWLKSKPNVRKVEKRGWQAKVT